jgi:ADP-heptose:LPS heptosyltransferase
MSTASDRECHHVTEALAEMRRLREAHELTSDAAARLATTAASAVLRQPQVPEPDRRAAVTLLCELANLDDPALSQVGIQGLFPSLVEPLGDAFTPEACAIYNQLFAQVIQYCRAQPAGAAIDDRLRRFGLVTEGDLLARVARLRRTSGFDRKRAQRIKKAFVLSRVTLGADIAVTSVVLAALKDVLPSATLKLVANAKTHQLFAGDQRIELCAIEYPRGGGLIERLASWQHTVEAIEQETLGLDATEYVIVDPDSRLTQLGLLPLVGDEGSYVFFESRSYGAAGLQKLSALTAHWLQQVFSIAGPVYPYCTPSLSDVVLAKRLAALLKASTAGSIISINLGVGANPAKRLPEPFELRLLERLLATGATIILDKGGEAQEMERIETLVTRLEGQGIRAVALDEHYDMKWPSAALSGIRLLTWQGGIGRFAAMIGESTAYIGYDSAGQHIAAALGVPTIDIFTGFGSPRMPERWSPYGRGAVHVLTLDAVETYAPARLDTLVDEVLAHLPGR